MIVVAVGFSGTINPVGSPPISSSVHLDPCEKLSKVDFSYDYFLCLSLEIIIDFVITYLSQTANFTPRFLSACRKTSFDKSGRRKSLSSVEFDNALEVLILSRALALSVSIFLSLGWCAPSKIT